MNEKPQSNKVDRSLVVLNEDFSINPFGLQNTGAICWMNSLVQALISMTHFNEIMLSFEDEFKSVKNQTALSIINMIKAECIDINQYSAGNRVRNNIQNNKNFNVRNYSIGILNNLLELDKVSQIEKRIKAIIPTIRTPLDMKKLLFIFGVFERNERKKYSQGPYTVDVIKYYDLINTNENLQKLILAYRGKRHEDLSFRQCSASEGFIKLFDKICCTPAFHMFNVRYLMKIICPNCNQMALEKRDHGCHIELFDNRINLQNEDDFTKYIHAHESELDEYKCEKCNTKFKKISRIEKLRMLREGVVILFNKYYKKINRWYPAEFKLPKGNNLYLRYELVATVEHSGGLGGGHYWARCRRNGKWYNFNDTSVREIPCVVPTPNTYMVFYHLVDDNYYVDDKIIGDETTNKAISCDDPVDDSANNEKK